MFVLILLVGLLASLKLVRPQVRTSATYSPSDFIASRFAIDTAPYYLNYSQTIYNPSSFNVSYPTGFLSPSVPTVIMALENIVISGPDASQLVGTYICFGLLWKSILTTSQFQFYLNN